MFWNAHMVKRKCFFCGFLHFEAPASVIIFVGCLLAEKILIFDDSVALTAEGPFRPLNVDIVNSTFIG